MIYALKVSIDIGILDSRLPYVAIAAMTSNLGLLDYSEEKLKELGAAIVYLFGSKAVGASTPVSDTDIGVVLKRPADSKDTRVLYNSLYDLFAEQYPTAKLDIVFLQIAPIPLQYQAISGGKVLFEADPRVTADYEEYVRSMYLDFKPILEYFDAISSKRYTHA